MNPLQELIAERLDALGLSQRAACLKSQGLLTASTLNRIIKGHHHQVTSKTIAGLALALEVPQRRVLDAAMTTAFPAQWEALMYQFGGLSPERQKQVIAALADAVQEEDRERAERTDAERPTRKRKARH